MTLFNNIDQNSAVRALTAEFMEWKYFKNTVIKRLYVII